MLAAAPAATKVTRGGTIEGAAGLRLVDAHDAPLDLGSRGGGHFSAG